MSEPRIRRTEVEDVRRIAAVGHASWNAAYQGIMPDDLIDQHTLRARIARAIKRWGNHDPEHRSWVLETQDELIAYSTTGLTREADGIPIAVGEIFSFYVHPAQWRKGYGRRLMRHVLADLFDRGFRETHLWVLSDNERARHFYVSMGFELDLDRVKKKLSEFEVEQTRYRMLDRAFGADGQA